jgi:predicted neuraminidase
MLDQKTDGKFSYPSMIRSKDGSIHLVYSWQMSRIKHLQFNDAWVYQQLHQALPTQSPFELAA